MRGRVSWLGGPAHTSGLGSVGEDRQPRTARGARPGLQVSHLAVTSAERSSRKISMRGDRERERERERSSK